MIEKLLLLAWRHIEFYFISFSSQSADTKQQPQSEVSNRLTLEEFQRLKQSLNCTLSPSLLKRLVDLESRYARSGGDETGASERQNDFVNILVKRIQRLLHLTSS